MPKLCGVSYIGLWTKSMMAVPNTALHLEWHHEMASSPDNEVHFYIIIVTTSFYFQHSPVTKSVISEVSLDTERVFLP